MANLMSMAGSSGRGLRAAGFAALLIALVAGSGGSAGAQGGGELKLTRIGGGFDFPVYVDDAPGSPELLFVVEQPGTIKVMRNGETLNGAFLDLRNRVLYGGEQGLLSIAFDPGYARNRRFYVYYVNHAGNIEVDGFRRSTRQRDQGQEELAREGDRDHASGQRQPQRRPAAVRPRRPPVPRHRRRRQRWRPRGQRPEQARACSASCCESIRARRAATRSRNRTRSAAAAARTRSTRSASATPTASPSTARPSDIYIGDVGQENWEEIDRASKGGLRGANFGWDLFEGDHPYEGSNPPPKYHPPIFEFSSANGTDNCSIVGGYVVRDPSLPALEGRYVYSDYCNSIIRSFDPSNPGASDQSTGLIPSPGAASSFGEGKGGQIYVVSHSGPVYKLVQE